MMLQEPEIDSQSEEGIKPTNMVGNIEFRGIQFVYPSRPDVTVSNPNQSKHIFHDYNLVHMVHIFMIEKPTSWTMIL